MRFTSLMLVLALGCSKKEAPKPTDNAPTQPTQPTQPTTAPSVAPTEPVRPPPPPVTADDIVARRLFADDVPTDKLALSIGIEGADGATRILIPRGTVLPTSIVELFTTSADNQTSVEVHVVQGERQLAADNRDLGKFTLVNIPPGAAGVPQIKVTFAVDAKGVFEVNALDLNSNTNKRLAINGGTLGTRFAQADVNKALAAESVAQKAQESAEAYKFGRAKLAELVVTMKAAMDNNAAYMSQDIQRELTTAIKKSQAWLDANPNTETGDVLAVQAATRDLMKIAAAAQADLAKSGK